MSELAMTTEVSHLDVIAANGVPFRAVVDRTEPGLFVAFYDRRYATHPSRRSVNGQFVAHYYIASLLEMDAHHFIGGLDMHGGVDDWKLDGITFALVAAWLRNVTSV